MSNKQKYQEYANALCKATEIAVEVINKFPEKNWKDENTKQKAVRFYEKYKEMIIEAEERHQNMSSLKFDYEAIFSFFQESSGEDVEQFWKRIKELNLPFKRENKLIKILKRKKIKNDFEYDFIIDVMIPYHEEGLISSDDFKLLNDYISDYELNNKIK